MLAGTTNDSKTGMGPRVWNMMTDFKLNIETEK